MRAHVLQHVPFEGLGSMAEWLARRGAEISYTKFFESAALPGIEGVDLLIAMGGPMSVNDERELPWLVAEKRFVAEMVRAGKPVLGVCLGAQLIASALGARVFKNAEKEIGWFPIEATSAESRGLKEESAEVFKFPASANVFHWHGETFDLPPGAVRLARSAACANQAFQVGARAIGLQFHLETTPASAEAIISNCRDELVPGRYVQSEGELRAAPAERYAEINALMGRVLEYLVRE